MSMYAEYLTERTNDQILENEYGFATYRFLENCKTVYIVDIYVVPEMREKGIAADMANQIEKIAKEKGCTDMIGTVLPSAKGSNTSLAVLLSYGMKLHSAAQDAIILRKDI